MKPNLAVFAPLPPALSGIASYTVDVLTYLKDFYTIECFVDDGNIPDVELLRAFPVHHYSAYRRRYEAIKFDATLYQWGSSRYHYYQADLLPQTHNNIVMLHDLNWSMALFNRYQQSKALFGFRAELARYLNALDMERYDEAVSVAQTGDTSVLNRFLMQHWLLDPIIDHSAAVCVQVIDAMLPYRYPKTAFNVIHQGTSAIRYTKAESRQNLGIPDNTFVIVVAGHVAPYKQVDKVVTAYREFLGDKRDCLLIIAGPHDDKQYTQHLLDQTASISYAVSFVGHAGDLDTPQFEQIIASADVFVGLRESGYFPQGMSRTVTQAMSTGAAVVVSDIPEWHYLGDSVIYAKGESLVEILKTLYYNKEQCYTNGIKAQAFYQTHLTIERMGQQYQAIIEKVIART